MLGKRINPDHLSALQLEQILCGESDPAVQAHLNTCAQCRAYLEAAPELASRFQQKYPAFSQLHHHRAALAPRPRFSFRGWVLLRPALAAFLVLAVAGGLWIYQQQSRPVLTAKGRLSCFLLLNGRLMHGQDEAIACRPGDTLQLGFYLQAPVYYMVLYRDDQGPLQRYLPAAAGDAGRLEPVADPAACLPRSIVLLPGWQREALHVFWSDAPFTFDQAVDCLQRGTGAVSPSSPPLYLKTYQLLNQEPGGQAS